jgi:hypothetical protein
MNISVSRIDLPEKNVISMSMILIPRSDMKRINASFAVPVFEYVLRLKNWMPWVLSAAALLPR